MTMTEKENFMRVVNGQEPAWVPRRSLIQFADVDPEQHKSACVAARAMVFPPQPVPGGGFIDVFGVEFEPVDSIGGQVIPVPNKFILDDITKWRDVIKAPSLDGIDWKSIADKALEPIDRHESAVMMGTHVGYFQHLMNFMGFTEGLCAMHEEPEEVLALYDYLANYYEAIAKNLIVHLKPDVYGITDDTATARSPFISVDMYRRLVKPYHARLAKVASDLGIPINMHNCGRCEDAIEDWRDFGVTLWDPAQTMNDLPAIKKKYGNSLVLSGCWDNSGPASWPGSSEELVRQAVRDCIDAYAPGGGFCFWASHYGAIGDEHARTHAFWITDEYNKYGRTFYQRQG